MSLYGKDILEKLFQELKQCDVVTVSGLADGVDTLCHELSLEHQIPTIAVLGGGVGHFLRSRKRELIHRIVDAGGLVLSEFKLKQKPAPYTFPQRNRIIAGLSEVLFVPEASQGSGSLITVDFALQMHKPVCVVPGSMFMSTSLGANQLLADGKARAVHDMGQFCAEFFAYTKKHPDTGSHLDLPSLSSDQKIIIGCFQEGALSLEALAMKTSLSVQTLIGELSMLEMEGLVQRVGNKRQVIV